MTKLKKGDVFGLLTLHIAGIPKSKFAFDRAWHCYCACGKVRRVLERNLIGGTTRSCGCTRYAGRGSGMSRHPAYKAYMAMVAKCRDYTRKSRKSPKTDPESKSDLGTAYGYVPRPIQVWPDVATFDLFWAALGPSWFPNSKLVRILSQPYAPHPTLDADSAMRVDNLMWVPK